MASMRRSLLSRYLLALALGSILLTSLAPGIALGAPLIAITKPVQGALVSGVIWIEVAYRSDSNRPITRLEIYIDDQLRREHDLATPLLEGRQSFNWDFSYSSQTVHKIAARAIDASGAAAIASINVQVQSAVVSGPDNIPPVVRIYYPSQGAKLRGLVEIKAEATDNVGVESVYFYIDGKLHKMMMNAPPYVDAWDTARESDGTHVLEALAVDAAENEARSAQVTVVVENHSMTRMDAGGALQPQWLPGVPVPAPAPALPPVPQPNEYALPTVVPAPVVPVGPPPAPAPALQPTGVAPPLLSVPEPQVVAPAPAPAPQPAAVLAPAPEPSVIKVRPRLAPPGPVPGAPASQTMPYVAGAPLSTGDARASAAQLASPKSSNAMGQPAAALSRPGISAASQPGGNAAAAVVQKAIAPSMEGTVAPAAARRMAAAPAAATLEPVRVGQGGLTSAPRPVSLDGAAVAAAGTLAPITVTTPELSPAGRPSVPLTKSYAPAGTLAPTAGSRTSAPARIAKSVVGPAQVAAAARPSLTPLLAPAPGERQKITPVGLPAPLGMKAALQLQPVVSVAPDHKVAPPSTLPRVSLPQAVPAKAVAAPKPVAKATLAPSTAAAAVPARSSAQTVAAGVKPPVTPAILSQAALAEYRGMPVPASRMLARLPETPAARAAADSRVSVPGPVAAVPLAVAPVKDIKIVFDGEVLSLRAAPETRRGISLAPLREIFEQTDGVLYWLPVEKSVRAVNKNVEMNLKIGDPKVTVNGEQQTLLIAPYIKRGRTMVPLQFIADVLDVNIAFDSASGQVLISSNQF